jgi:hypothetical protein
LCYEIGFGTKRDSEKASQWLTKSHADFESAEQLDIIDKKYNASDAKRLNAKLGYAANLPFDPVALFRVQNRLDLAEAAFRSEVEGREESFGPKSRSFLSQLSTLSIILLDNRKMEEAVSTCQRATETCSLIYGPDDLETISAMNYLSHVLFAAGKWSEVEKLQLQLIVQKEAHDDIGPTDPTTLNSQNTLLAIYCFQERYDECLSLAEKLVTFRNKQLSPKHPETLTTNTWICRALLEKEDLDGLEDRTRELVAMTANSMGPNDKATLQVKEVFSAVLLGLSLRPDSQLDERKLNEGLELVIEIVSEIEPVPSDSEESADAQMDDDTEDADDEDQDEEQEQTRPGPRDLTIFLRANTSLACFLALKRDFEAAEEAICLTEAAMPEGMDRENIELRRCLEIKDVISRLGLLHAGLSADVQNPLHSDEASLRSRLAHRWRTQAS